MRGGGLEAPAADGQGVDQVHGERGGGVEVVVNINLCYRVTVHLPAGG